MSDHPSCISRGTSSDSKSDRCSMDPGEVGGGPKSYLSLFCPGGPVFIMIFISHKRKWFKSFFSMFWYLDRRYKNKDCLGRVNPLLGEKRE